MSVNEVRGLLRDPVNGDEQAAVAVLLRAWRSAPRAPGARFAAGPDGRTAGSISAGCVEADLEERLRAISGGENAGIVRYGISDSDATAVGLSCGGEIEVLLRRHDPGDPAWQRLERALDEGEAAVLATCISEPRIGHRVLVTAEGDRVGSMGDPELDRAVREQALLLGRGPGRAEVIEVRQGVEVFFEPFLPARRLILVGATRIALALAELARPLEIGVIIVEPRAELARRARETGVETVEAAPSAAFAELHLGRRDAVAVLAHEERLDVDALEAALAAGAGYLGLLGGRRTQRTRRQALVERGVPSERIDTVHGPIGLDISAESPPEIALSILAQLVDVWNDPVSSESRR